MSNNSDDNTQLLNALQVLAKAVMNKNTPAPRAPASNEPATASVPAVAQVNGSSPANFLADLTRFLPPPGQDHLRQLDPAVVAQFDHHKQQERSTLDRLMSAGAAYGAHRVEILELCYKHNKRNCQDGHIMVDLPPSLSTSQHFSYMSSSSQSVSIEQIRLGLGYDKLSVGFSHDSADIKNQERLEFIFSDNTVVIPAVGCVFCPMRVEGVPSQANQEIRFSAIEGFETFMADRRKRQIENMR